MTDRIKGFTIVLDSDIKDDDLEYIENAIRMIKGVAGIQRSIVNAEDYMNRERIKLEFRQKCWDFVDQTFE